jgi:hypothetical protein
LPKPPPADPITTMRRAALEEFLEEHCGTILLSYEMLAETAGVADVELPSYLNFAEFQLALVTLGYGVGAGEAWWLELFKSVDADRDGRLSRQDLLRTLAYPDPPPRRSLSPARPTDQASSSPHDGDHHPRGGYPGLVREHSGSPVTDRGVGRQHGSKVGPPGQGQTHR